MSERKEMNEVGSYNHLGFLLGGIHWPVEQGKEFKLSMAFLFNGGRQRQNSERLKGTGVFRTQ